MEEKNPILAGFLNVLIVGLAHVYVGNWGRAIATFIVIYITFPFLAYVVGGVTQSGICTGILALSFLAVAFADGYQAVTKYNAKLPKRKCPYCAEYIKEEAKVCKHCGREIEGA